VRFSKDKSPYNTHRHLGFQDPREPGGRAARRASTFGLEADRLTLGVGAFDFGPADLERYRRAVAATSDGEELVDILSRIEPARRAGPQARPRRPIPADHPRGELLRRKGLNVWQDVADPRPHRLADLADCGHGRVRDSWTR
jgi:hypothetical protein